MDLLASALLMKLAGLNGQAQAPQATDAAVWLYADIVPRGLLKAERAGLVLQVVSLSMASAVPEALIGQMTLEAQRLWLGMGLMGYY